MYFDVVQLLRVTPDLDKEDGHTTNCQRSNTLSQKNIRHMLKYIEWMLISKQDIAILQ